jgi:hypothetical protein
MGQWQQLQLAEEAAAGPRIVEPLAADMDFNADMYYHALDSDEQYPDSGRTGLEVCLKITVSEPGVSWTVP